VWCNHGNKHWGIRPYLFHKWDSSESDPIDVYKAVPSIGSANSYSSTLMHFNTLVERLVIFDEGGSMTAL